MPKIALVTGLANASREAPYLSAEVAWAPATFQSGLSFQKGWLVVRPGWVVFLPSNAAINLVAGMGLAVAGFIRVETGRIVYDFAGLCREGPASFDAAVMRLAEHGGRVLRASEGDAVKLPKGSMLRWDPKTFVICDALLPEPLLAGWKLGKVEFNARELAVLFAVITAIPALLAAFCGLSALYGWGGDPSIIWGVPFWGVLVVGGWAGYLYAYIRHKRQQRQSRG